MAHFIFSGSYQAQHCRLSSFNVGLNDEAQTHWFNRIMSERER